MMNGSVEAIVDRLDRGAVVAEAVQVNDSRTDGSCHGAVVSVMNGSQGLG